MDVPPEAVVQRQDDQGRILPSCVPDLRHLPVSRVRRNEDVPAAGFVIHGTEVFKQHAGHVPGNPGKHGESPVHDEGGPGMASPELPDERDDRPGEAFSRDGMVRLVGERGIEGVEKKTPVAVLSVPVRLLQEDFPEGGVADVRDPGSPCVVFGQEDLPEGLVSHPMLQACADGTVPVDFADGQIGEIACPGQTLWREVVGHDDPVVPVEGFVDRGMAVVNGVSRRRRKGGLRPSVPESGAPCQRGEQKKSGDPFRPGTQWGNSRIFSSTRSRASDDRVLRQLQKQDPIREALAAQRIRPVRKDRSDQENPVTGRVVPPARYSYSVTVPTSAASAPVIDRIRFLRFWDRKSSARSFPGRERVPSGNGRRTNG